MKRALAAGGVMLLVLAACAADATDSVDPTETTIVAAASTTMTPVATTTTIGPTTTTGVTGPFATVEAANGAVDIPERPASIVSLSPTATEMLFAIGAGPQVVAVDEFSDYPEEAPITDLSGYTPNLEAIASYGPDLIVVGHDTDGLVGALEAVGVPVLLLPAAVTFEDVFGQMRTLGDATGNSENAVAAVATLEAEIDEILSDVGDLGTGLAVYHELDPTFYSVTSVTFIGRVYDAFGLDNIADAADVDGFGYPQLSAEYILERNPDLIVVTDCCGDTADSVAERPGWESISAVQSDSVVVVDGDVSSRWGPRIVEFLRTIATLITGLAG